MTADPAALWVVKPATRGEGRGIFVSQSADDIRLKTSRQSRWHHGPRVLVQRMMTNPHLIDGLKYDLRTYVLVTKCADRCR